MMGGIIPFYLCWRNSSKEETGIPISSRSERSVQWRSIFSGSIHASDNSSLEGIGVIFAVGTSNMYLLIWRD